MSEVRQFCRETWGKNWWDVAEDVKEARKRVASGVLGGEPADEATATLAGDVEAARTATPPPILPVSLTRRCYIENARDRLTKSPVDKAPPI